MRFRLALAVLVLTSVASHSSIAVARPSATQPADKPADTGGEDFALSPMRVQELQGVNYLYLSDQTSLNQVHQTVAKLVNKLSVAIKTNAAKPVGGVLLIFHGATTDRDHVFTLDVGMPIAADAAGADGFTIKKLDSFRCATVLFSGNTREISRAYEKVYTDLTTAGLEPTDEARESILMWEGESSVNNVVMVQVGVK